MKRKRKQQGSITAENGAWYLRYWQQRSENGILKRKRLRVRLGPATNRKIPHAIRDEAERIMAGVNASDVDPENIRTIGWFAESVYLPHVTENLRPSTATGYRQIWNSYLKGECASTWLNAAKTKNVTAWLSNINRKCKLSKTTLGHVRFVLSGLFSFAIEQEYRDADKGNPAMHAIVPKGTKDSRATHAYLPEEIRAMLIAFPEPARSVVAVCAFTALRVGEVEGLLWEDLRGDELHVGRSVWRGKVSDPKTEQSAAPVKVVPQLRRILEDHRARSGNPTVGPMFRTSLGTRLSMGNVLNRYILPVTNRCAVCGKPKGVQHIPSNGTPIHEWQRDPSAPTWRGWHGFRRSVATNLQRQGEAPATAQGALRHSGVEVTLKHYTKTVPKDVGNALEKWGNSILPVLTDHKSDHSEGPGAQPEIVN